MANYKPSFDSYRGSQGIVTSDRVIILGKNDCVFVLGKKAVSIASPGTVNIDSENEILLKAPKVKLGLTIDERGEPVLLGNKTVDILQELLSSISLLSQALSKMSETGLAESIPPIRIASNNLLKLSENIKQRISYFNNDSFIQSKITYTK